MMSIIFWYVTSRSPLKVNGRFGGTYLLHLQGRNINRASRTLLATFFHTGFLFGLFFEPDDGGDMFLRKFGWLNRLHGVISQKIVFFIT
jgi:hypothetical protein